MLEVEPSRNRKNMISSINQLDVMQMVLCVNSLVQTSDMPSYDLYKNIFFLSKNVILNSTSISYASSLKFKTPRLPQKRLIKFHCSYFPCSFGVLLREENDPAGCTSILSCQNDCILLKLWIYQLAFLYLVRLRLPDQSIAILLDMNIPFTCCKIAGSRIDSVDERTVDLMFYRDILHSQM